MPGRGKVASGRRRQAFNGAARRAWQPSPVGCGRAGSSQDQRPGRGNIRARHAAGEPLRAIAPDYGVSHQALSKGLRRARPRPAQQRQRQPQRAAEPRQLSGPSAAAAVAAISPSRRGLAEGLVRLRRGNQARWVDPLAESARYEQLLAEGFTAQTTRA
ncbi:MAG TPA: hypothetical protein VIM33_00235 [Gaiellaceae bacterium]